MARIAGSRPSRVPALLQRAGRSLDVGQLPLERLEPGLGGVVLLLAKRLALDLELDPPALELVELDRHRVDLHDRADDDAEPNL